MESKLEKFLERLGGESRIRLGLDPFKQALAALGHPEKSVKTIVIAGTNGKGTVSLFVSSALKAAGYSVGTYLSPHLQHFTERFLDNGLPAKLEALEKLLPELEPIATQFGLSYFEFQTLLCFFWSREAGHDYLVLEVGLGGRLDATNVTDPLITCITNIDLDHEKYLGSKRESILEEKMGILRDGVPVYSSVRSPSLMAALEKRCQERSIPLTYGWKTSGEPRTVDWNGQSVLIDGHPFTLSNPSIGTLENATLAYSLLRKEFPAIALPTLQKAFSVMRNPGRMEVVAQNPRVVLSGDHNLAGSTCLLETLHDLQTRPRIVCAFSPDKPYQELLRRLQSVSDDVLLTQITRLASQMPPDYRYQVAFVEDPQHAIEEMLGRCKPEDTLLVTGSLYLVGEVRGFWHPAGVDRPLF